MNTLKTLRNILTESLTQRIEEKISFGDPNRGKPGRAKPKFGHFPDSSEREKIRKELGNLPFPKRQSKPINMQRRFSQVVRQHDQDPMNRFEPDTENVRRARFARDQLGHYQSGKSGYRYQPTDPAPLPQNDKSIFDRAKDAGSPLPSNQANFENMDRDQRIEKMLMKRFPGKSPEAFNSRKRSGNRFKDPLERLRKIQTRQLIRLRTKRGADPLDV